MSSPDRIHAVLALAIVQGFLGMGFQLVASRLLSPYFGTTLIVWAFLISVFLAAFLGGIVSQLDPRRRRIGIAALGIVGTAWFAFVALAGWAVVGAIEQAIEALWLAVCIACVLLFLLPVAALSALLPIYTDLVEQGGRGAGISSGLVFGTSTFGNIVGVIVTAFALIPNFPTSELLVGWWLCALACFAGAYRIAR